MFEPSDQMLAHEWAVSVLEGREAYKSLQALGAHEHHQMVSAALHMLACCGPFKGEGHNAKVADALLLHVVEVTYSPFDPTGSAMGTGSMLWGKLLTVFDLGDTLRKKLTARGDDPTGNPAKMRLTNAIRVLEEYASAQDTEPTAAPTENVRHEESAVAPL